MKSFIEIENNRIILIILITTIIISASEKNFSLPIDYRFSRLTMEDGLSKSTVKSIIQDHKGYMWFATASGINRYDGYNFVVYNNDPLDSSSISENGITSVFEDKNGNIWIGTNNGVLNEYLRDKDSFKRIRFKNTGNIIAGQNIEVYEYPIIFSRNLISGITAICEDNNGNLWIGTWGEGLIIYNPLSGKYTRFLNKIGFRNSLPSNRLMDIKRDKFGNMWLATFGGGITKVSLKNFNLETYNSDNILFTNYNSFTPQEITISDDRAVTLYFDSDNNLYVGTFGGGLNYIQFNSSGLNIKYIKNDKSNANSLSNDKVMAIAEDKTGNLWIGTFGGGLTKIELDKENYTRFFHDPHNINSIADNDVISILIDPTGIIWLGTHLGKGISRLEGKMIKFKSYDLTSKPALNDNVVWAIHEDENKNIWIGTYKGGINLINRKTGITKYFKSFLGSNDNDENHIRAITEDKNGNIWIGTYSKGLHKYDTHTGRFYSFRMNKAVKTSIGADQIQTLYVDKNNILWIGTFGGGLNKLDLNKETINFEKYQFFPELSNVISDNRVYSIYEDKSGIMWIGTFGGGLNKFDPVNKTFTNYKNIQEDISSLSDNRVTTIHEDKFGNLWVGTFGGGLNKFDKKKKTFLRYNTEKGFNCNVVYGILSDNNDNIWMSTDNGIVKMNLTNNMITYYDINDGVQSKEFSGGAYLKTKSGEMFFGGVNGLNYFFPDSVKDNPFIPPVVITEFSIHNKPVKGDFESIELDYGDNYFSFAFAALDFSNSKENKYAYLLEGFESEWTFTSAEKRTANYTNIPPGNYTFKVRGANNDGIWNNIGASVNIKVLTPFYKTWWFIGGTITLIAGLIVYLSTFRIRNTLAIEKLKSQIAADLHDSIGSGLTEISILSELAANDLQTSPDSVTGRLKTISNTSRELIDKMSDIVWMINPKRDSLNDLILRLKSSYSELLPQMGISFKTKNLESVDNVKLPMEYKQNLFLIFKEGINNSIKHSKSTNISLEANIIDSKLELILSDNGIGISDSYKSMGNGIINMKTRAGNIKGKLIIETMPANGTTIKFLGKIPQSKLFADLVKK